MHDMDERGRLRQDARRPARRWTRGGRRHKSPRGEAEGSSRREASMRLFKLVIASVFTFVMLGDYAARAVEPVKIRIGWVVPISDWVLFMVEKRELARHFGKSYIMEPVRFASSPSVITAMANDELDIGNLAFSTLALAIQNAGMQDLQVISDLIQDHLPRYYTNDNSVHRHAPPTTT